MDEFKLFNSVDPNILSQYQILCLPENIRDLSEDTDLIDPTEAIVLSKLLKEEGIKCGNSYDIGLNAKVSERKSVDMWLGSIWILDKAVLPLLLSVLGRLLGEKISKTLNSSKALDESQEAKVHVTLKIINGKISEADVEYSGNASNFLKVLNGINNDESLHSK